MVRGQERYLGFFHDWQCFAAPIWSPPPARELLGFLDLSMHADQPVGFAMAAVINTADLIGNVAVPARSEALGGGGNAGYGDRLRVVVPKLSEQQMAVLKHLARGESARQIACTLHIQESTVQYHIRVLFDKLKARNAVNCAVKALLLGLISEADLARD